MMTECQVEKRQQTNLSDSITEYSKMCLLKWSVRLRYYKEAEPGLQSDAVNVVGRNTATFLFDMIVWQMAGDCYNLGIENKLYTLESNILNAVQPWKE